MNYSQSLLYLNSFHNFEKISLGSSSPEWNLDRMRLLLGWAGHPEKSFFPVLIAGTKGKGSTGFFLESILKASGTSAGFYSSPHFESPRERIRIQGKIVSKKTWCEGLAKIEKLLNGKELLRHKNSLMSSPKAVVGDPGFKSMDSRLQHARMTGNKRASAFTYFEIMTLLAALVFKRAGIQVGIFEVGMGGRLDATNAIDHKLAILTPIHLDHEAVLGNTISKIAFEKAAIIRRGEPVVVSPQHSDAMKVIRVKARQQRAKIEQVTVPAASRLGLIGDYQKINAAAAEKAALILRDKFRFQVTAKGVREGLQAQNWPGRFEVFNIGSAVWVLDGAHNPISIEALVRNLKARYASRPRILIFGTSRDKDSLKMLRLLGGYFKEIILTRAQNSRSREIPELMAQARGFFDRIYPFAKVSQAIEFAKTKASSGSLIVVTGSFYVIGEARKLVLSDKL